MSTFRDDVQHILVLQGGGALGSYQAGAFETMAADGCRPDYVAGISIGAINAALIAGNRPEDRVARLHAFWDRVTKGDWLGNAMISMMDPYLDHGRRNQLHSAQAMFAGIPGFYRPRNPGPFFHTPGTPEALSFYDTEPLRATLLELVDFDYLNSGAVRLTVGAVNVETGNQTYFDTTQIKIGPEHIMASGALPPGFPPVEIEGQFYWDGGIVSNTPLQYVIENHDENRDATVFQFDLFGAQGRLPQTVAEIEGREKDIRFSSRTRYSSDQMAHILKLRAAVERLYAKLPKELQDSDEARLLMGARHEGKVLLIQMIYRQAQYESASKDYEFSRASMREHWAAGAADAERAMLHASRIKAKAARNPLTIVDASRPFEAAE